MRLFPVRGGYYRISDRNAKNLSEEWGGLPVRGVATITVTLPNGCKATLSRRNYGSPDGLRSYIWCILPDGNSTIGVGIKQPDGSWLCEAKPAKEAATKAPPIPNIVGTSSATVTVTSQYVTISIT